MPKLILKKKGTKKEESYDFEREEVSVGRSESNSIVLDDAGVSRTHIIIFPDAKDFYIKDIGSGNGTLLNGRKLPKNEKYILRHNDLIGIEDFDLKFVMIDEMLNESLNDITDSDVLEVKLLRKVLKALDRETIPSIEVLNGTAEGKKIFLTDDINELAIGRDPMCEFQIEEYVISRRHARIIKKWGGIIIEDLGSKNGVYVNNRKVKEEFLHDGDRIALGTIVMIFRNPKEVNIDEIRSNIEKERQLTSPPVAEEKSADTEAKGEGADKEASSDGETLEDDDEVSYTGKALSEEEQKALVARAEKQQYPKPEPSRQRIKFKATELCFIGLGVLVFIFGIIMIVNLLFT